MQPCKQAMFAICLLEFSPIFGGVSMKKWRPIKTLIWKCEEFGLNFNKLCVCNPTWKQQRMEEYHSLLLAFCLWYSKCSEGTCDGCSFHFLWRSQHACPLCSERNYKEIVSACIQGIQVQLTSWYSDWILKKKFPTLKWTIYCRTGVLNSSP